MAIKKKEIYSSLWASCDKLRGGMDASQYKDYILKMMLAVGEIRLSGGVSSFLPTAISLCHK